MKKTYFALLAAAAGLLLASPADGQTQKSKDFDFGYFNHLSLGLNIGLDGFGAQVAAPLGGHFQVRAGANFLSSGEIKQAKYDIPLDLDGVSDPSKYPDKITVTPTLNMNKANLLFDYFPFKKSSFHVTAGAYYAFKKPIISVDNRETPVDLYDDGAQIGYDFGEHFATTDENGIVTLELRTNRLRPYLGIGFGRPVSRHRVNVTMDLGLMYWGKMGIWSYDVDKKEFQITGDDLKALDPGNKDLEDAAKVIDTVTEHFIFWPVLNMHLFVRLF